MPKISVYRCPFTGNIFHGKEEYAEHLRETRIVLHRQRDEKRAAVAWAESLVCAGKMVNSLDLLAQWFIKNQGNLYPMINKNSAFYGRDVNLPIILKLRFERFEFNEKTGNTHSSPRAGVTNFGWKEDKPRGYPGMRGRVTIWTVKGSFGFWLSDILKEASIHSGTGGSASTTNSLVQKLSYECILWLDDWPELFTEFTFAKLTGGTSSPLYGEYNVPEYFPESETACADG